MKEGVVSFELQRQKNFNQDQMYVALSRISKVENMHLVGKYHRNAIKKSKCQKRICKIMQQVTSDTLIITLLNVRSLRKHSDDIFSDIGLVNSDILCLTETQEENRQLHQNFKGTSQCILIPVGIGIRL